MRTRKSMSRAEHTFLIWRACRALRSGDPILAEIGALSLDAHARFSPYPELQRFAIGQLLRMAA